MNAETLSQMTGLSLDMAFEKVTSPASGKTVQRFAGPTHMQCRIGAAGDETCVVTAEAKVAAVPAAMAPR